MLAEETARITGYTLDRAIKGTPTEKKKKICRWHYQPVKKKTVNTEKLIFAEVYNVLNTYIQWTETKLTIILSVVHKCNKNFGSDSIVMLSLFT